MSSFKPIDFAGPSDAVESSTPERVNFFPNSPPGTWCQIIEMDEGKLDVQLSVFLVTGFAKKVSFLFSVVSCGLLALWFNWYPHHWLRIFGHPIKADELQKLLSRTTKTKQYTHVESMEYSAQHYPGINTSGPFTSSKVSGLKVADGCNAVLYACLKNSWFQTTITEVMTVVFEKNGGDISLMIELRSPSELCVLVDSMVYFEYRGARFFWVPQTSIFIPSTSLVTVCGPLSALEKQAILGMNSISVPPPRALPELFRILQHPLFVFQLFSMILWSTDNYYYYAACILFLTICSSLINLVEAMRSKRRLSEMSSLSCQVKAKRNYEWCIIDSTQLVPGDIIGLSLRDWHVVPCDMVLISGDCIVDESMLTGESVAVSKFPLEDLGYLKAMEATTCEVPQTISKSFLFGGTHLLRVRPDEEHPNGQMATALVVRTGFYTTHGTVIRTMLHPRPHVFKFYSDSMRFLGVMFIVSIFFAVHRIHKSIEEGKEVFQVIVRALDLITIVVPPALPATMTIGTLIALRRLKKSKIFCISQVQINVAGKVDYVCFDKTGTLTEDGLSVHGMYPVNLQGPHFGTIILEPSECTQRLFLEALATCHEIRVLDSRFVGDPLDIRMFEWTNWKLSESVLSTSVRAAGDPLENEIGIVKTFEFLSDYRRMSVVVKSSSTPFRVFCKGAPEAIIETCIPDTLPSDFTSKLNVLTKLGFRVIAFAYREFPTSNLVKMERMTRLESESELTFLGFLVFDNKVKPSTRGTIEVLNRAKILTSMCTGDNMRTAISVGRECGILHPDHELFFPELENGGLKWLHVSNSLAKLDAVTISSYGISNHRFSLAITGVTFDWMSDHCSEEVMQRILYKTKIFARMTPQQKKQVVEGLQRLGYIVAFCGDGANDCSALKVSDVGISLSVAEASVAAHFTSGVIEISCVPELIRHGRAALVTCFSCFKFMALYSMLQATSVAVLSFSSTSPTDIQFILIDLGIIFPLAITMARSQAYPRLVACRPLSRLLSSRVLTSVIINSLAQAVFQITALALLHRWGDPNATEAECKGTADVAFPPCRLNTFFFHFTAFQYVVVSIMFYAGPPYREPLVKCFSFLAAIAVVCALNVLLMFGPVEAARPKLMIKNLDKWHHGAVIVMAAVYLVLTVFLEHCLSPLVARLASVGVNKFRWARARVLQQQRAGKKFKELANVYSDSGQLP